MSTKMMVATLMLSMLRVVTQLMVLMMVWNLRVVSTVLRLVAMVLRVVATVLRVVAMVLMVVAMVLRVRLHRDL